MRIKIYLVFLILTFSLDTLAQLKIEISNIKDEWILGEPIMIEIYLKNESNGVLRIYGSLIKFTSPSSLKLHISPMEGVEKIPEKTEEQTINLIYEYKPLWQYRIYTGLFDFMIRKPGLYNIKVIYDMRIQGNRYLNKGVYLGPTESNEIQLKVKEPQGIDNEAYNYFETYPLANRNELLQKYPTSTYAGWALLKKYSGATYGGYKTAKEMIDDLSLSDEERKINNARSYGRKDLDNPGWISPIPIAEEYIRLAEAFLKEHPDFAFASVIYARIGLSYMVLHRWKEAYISLDKALKLGLPNEWPASGYELSHDRSRYDQFIKEAKDELIKRGWAK